MAEPLKATFYAFKSRDRAVLLPATITLVVLLGALLAAFAAVNWNFFVTIYEMWRTSMANGGVQDTPPDAFVGGMFMFIGTCILFMFPMYMIVAAYEAACLRWMIRGEAPGLFGFTIDYDMWRVYGIYWCWLVAQWVVSTVASIIMIPLMFATMGDIMANPNDTDAMMRWQLTVQLPVTLLQYIPLIFIGIRFGPAAATSVLRKKFSFFDAWKVTRGRFWELFGAYALLWAVLIVINIVSFAAALGPGAQQLFTLWQSAASGAVSSEAEVQRVFSDVFSPDRWPLLGVAYALNLVCGFTYILLSYGINARAAQAALDEGKIDVPA